MMLASYSVDLFMTSSHFYYQRYIDHLMLKRYRDEGLVVLTKIDFWNGSEARLNLSEAKGLRVDRKQRYRIEHDLLGDMFHHVVEQGDPRMVGFEEETGRRYSTIPLAADDTMLGLVEYDNALRSDIAFIGTFLPSKRSFFRKYVFPLGDYYNLRLWGQGWNRTGRLIGNVKRLGQLYNIPVLAKVGAPKLSLVNELSIYRSSLVSINVHEEQQKYYGGDCNERTFKIPLSGGFEVVDNVACVGKYFNCGSEMVVAANDADWRDKVEFYLRHPDERIPIIEAGRRRVLDSHTYQVRVQQIEKLYNEFVRDKWGWERS